MVPGWASEILTLVHAHESWCRRTVILSPDLIVLIRGNLRPLIISIRSGIKDLLSVYTSGDFIEVRVTILRNTGVALWSERLTKLTAGNLGDPNLLQELVRILRPQVDRILGSCPITFPAMVQIGHLALFDVTI